MIQINYNDARPIYEKVKDSLRRLILTGALPPDSKLVTGKGAGSEYEIMLAREIFNNAVPAEHKMGDVFYTGIRFYGYGWSELSNMPNTSVEEGEGTGYAHLMKITTVK